MIESLGSIRLPRVDSVALIGGYDPNQPHLDANLLVRRFSDRSGGTAHILNSPAWLPTLETKEVLLSHPVIKATVELWDRVDVAFTGSGMPPDESSNYFTVADRWSSEVRSSLTGRGVVGDVIGATFDIRGEFIHSVLTDHMLCPSIDQIRRMPTVVGLLGGHAKRRTLIGLARTGLVDVIITDRHCAEGALELLASGV